MKHFIEFFIKNMPLRRSIIDLEINVGILKNYKVIWSIMKILIN